MFFKSKHLEEIIKKYTVFLNVFVIFSISISVYSLGFNLYLKKKLDSYLLITEDILKRYENVKIDLKKFEQKLTFVINVRDTVNVLRKFARWYDDKILKDIAFALVEESIKNDIDPLLMLAIMKTESSFRYSSVSAKGAVGLMQILPDTAYYISDKIADFDVQNKNELFDPVINIRLGVNYFAYLMNKLGDQKLSIIAYNFGPSNLKSYIEYGKNPPLFYYYKVMDNYHSILSDSGRI